MWKSLCSVCLLLLLWVNMPNAAAQVQYRSGPLVHSPATDFVTGFTPLGTGYFVSQAFIANPPQPYVNQPYYVSVYMSGIASPAVGRLMAVHFIPPAGTTVVANASTPVRCYYRAMNGSGSQVEFTNTVITDTSFGASLRVFGCPQPATNGNPYQIVTLPNGNGTAYFLDRRDPLRQGQVTWPLGSQASYEFLIPVVSNRTMDGTSFNDRFYAPTQSIQGDGLDPWVYPYLSLLVSPNKGGATADMQARAYTAAPAPPATGRTVTQFECINLGPNTAQNASCGFSNAPSNLNPVVFCSPTSPQASLAVNGIIRCTLTTDQFIGAMTVTGVAGSSTIDPTITNNTFDVTLNGRLTDGIFSAGFE